MKIIFSSILQNILLTVSQPNKFEETLFCYSYLQVLGYRICPFFPYKNTNCVVSLSYYLNYHFHGLGPNKTTASCFGSNSQTDLPWMTGILYYFILKKWSKEKVITTFRLEMTLLLKHISHFSSGPCEKSISNLIRYIARIFLSDYLIQKGNFVTIYISD